MAASRKFTVALFFLGVCVALVASLIEPITLPKDFSSCLHNQISHNNDSDTPLHTIQEFCLNNFLSLNPHVRGKANFTTDEEKYINSLFRQVISLQNEKHGRFRRHANGQWRRYRRELRSAPYSHWRQFAAAIVRLKRQKAGPNSRSLYDTIAEIHVEEFAYAHGGATFNPWHRLYVFLFETAAGVPIPYWDQTIDFELPDPTQSILWTSKYFGNGRGNVVTGPFRNFGTPTGPLRRAIGVNGLLLSKKRLQPLLVRDRNSEIFEPALDTMQTLEGQHNQGHVWVGGQTADFIIAPYDPLFWSYHAYVDLLWETFRENQRKKGINPETDVIESSDFRFDQDRFVRGYKKLRVRDGFSNLFSNLVTYKVPPQCPQCGNSKDLYCDIKRKVCVTVTDPGRNHGSFLVGHKQKRSIVALPGNSIHATEISQNSDGNNSVFFPIRVIKVDKVDGELRHLFNASHVLTQNMDQMCTENPTTINKDTIFVQATGLNYDGQSKDFVKLHESTFSYIGIQNPRGDSSDAYISAFDKCGRICTPNCLILGSHPPFYKTCTGAVRATMEHPRMFSSYEAISGVMSEDEPIPIVFHCTI